MENIQTETSKVLPIIGILILIAGAALGIWFYLKDRKPAEIAADGSVPSSIGDYKLEPQGSEDTIKEELCADVGTPPKGSEPGISAQVCTTDIKAEYHQVGGDKIVYVHLTTATKGAEFLKYMYSKVSKPEKLGTHEVVRLTEYEIAWYPQSGYDVIVAQEGSTKSGFPERATGNNPVTKYFVEKFPPETREHS